MDTQTNTTGDARSTVDRTPAGLIALGFEATTYPGQDGTYFTTRVEVRWMPYLSQQVDNDQIYEDSSATVEITPSGGIQFVLSDTGYTEQFSDAFAGDGLDLLTDVLAAMSVRPRSIPASGGAQ